MNLYLKTLNEVKKSNDLKFFLWFPFQSEDSLKDGNFQFVCEPLGRPKIDINASVFNL